MGRRREGERERELRSNQTKVYEGGGGEDKT